MTNDGTTHEGSRRDVREDWHMTDAEVDYWNLVERDTMTCFACPTQWEGTLKDGRKFYFRYRHGYAALGVSPTDPIGATFGTLKVGDQRAGMAVGGALDGYMDDREYREAFVKLWGMMSRG